MSGQGRAKVNTEVSWQLDVTSVEGTLVRPEGDGPFPAAVMVAGSGPTDRDWNSPLLPGTNGSAQLLAGELARAGFASLRYDKRASGPRARENMQALIGKVSMQSHLDELSGAVRMLAGQEFVREDRIFAIANSEGTLHALHYQLQDPAIPLAGLVLIAPPGRAVGAVARSQLAEQAAAAPNGDALMARYDRAIEQFMAAEPFAPDPGMPQGIQMVLQGLMAPANLPFARELWLADASPLLARVEVPVLVIIGKKDIQVDWKLDGEPLQRAADGRTQVTFRFPEDANHVMKHEARPRAELIAGEVAANYNSPEARLDPEALCEMLGWLTARV